MAILSAALLSTGVIRHYVDIWRHKTVRGISFLFITIDALGDVTSALALSESFSFYRSKRWKTSAQTWNSLCSAQRLARRGHLRI